MGRVRGEWWGVVVGIFAALNASAEPFALVHRERASGLALAGALGELVLLTRNGESVDAVDPASGAVVRRFVRPPDVAALGAESVVVGAELWIGAPAADGGRGAVVVFDATSGVVLRTVRPAASLLREAGFGWSLAATADRVAVGAPFSDGGGGSVHLFDADSGDFVGRRSVNAGYFGADIAAADHSFFVAWPQDGFLGAVLELDEKGDIGHRLDSPAANEPMDHFGAAVAVVGGSVYVGARYAAFPAGRVYRFDIVTGAFVGTVASDAAFTFGFGAPLVARGDGLLVGEPSHVPVDDDPFGASGGVVHLVDAVTGALRWTFRDPDGAPSFAAFGRPIVAAGPWVAVGDMQRGAAYVFADLARCGDGAVDAGERCDDGNLTSGDGCDANCMPTGCGNAIRTGDESCDDGNQLDDETCGPTCRRVVVCGDGVVDGVEACDDHNLVDGDGCDHDCTVTGCGNGIVTAGEDCDDANDENLDACPNDCNLVLCGDGVVEGGEECDDGNAFDEDGCSPFCIPVAGPYGVGATDVIVTYVSTLLGAERAFPVRIWYPAAPPPPGTTDATAPLDVPAAAGRFPLLLDSHGYGAPTFESTWNNGRAYFLARNGYVVAAPFHPNDLTTPFGTLVGVRPEDLRVLLDRLLDPATVPALLRNHVDPDRVGAMGQSLGGITATATTVNGFFGSVRDPRIKAVLGTGSENYVFTAAELATARVPIMLLIGDRDPYFPGTGLIHVTYERHQAPRFLVEIRNGDHATPITAGGCPLPYCSHRGALRYPLAFFDTYLRNDRPAVALLDPGAETEFGDVEYLRDPGPAVSLGGTARTDCMVALGSAIGDALDDTPLRTLACTDGAACDTDPLPGRCGFDVRLCVNPVDRRAIACTPTDVASLRVRNPQADTELARLQAAATALTPTSDRRCSAPVRVTVTLGPRRAIGRRRVHVRARDTANRQDADRYLLECLRAS